MSGLAGRAHRGAARVCVCVNRLGPVCVEFGTLVRFVRRTVAAWLGFGKGRTRAGRSLLFWLGGRVVFSVHLLIFFILFFSVVVLECDFFFLPFSAL